MAGPPIGLVERLIASCYVVGKVEQGLCWRHGAAFTSHAMAAAREGDRFRVLVSGQPPPVKTAQMIESYFKVSRYMVLAY